MQPFVIKQCWFASFLAVLFSTLLLITFAFAQGNGNKPDDRLPPPPDSLARDVVAAVKGVFREELAKANRPAEKSALAKQLISQAATFEQPYERWAMLSEAARLAAEAGDVETAFAAADTLSKGYALDPMALELDVIQRMSSRATTSVARELATRVMTISKALASAGDLERAEQVTEMMPPLLVRARDRQLSLSLRAFQKKLDDQMAAREAQEKADQKIAAKRAQLVQRVQENPEDTAACLEAGQFFCFELNDWQTGLPLLARGADPLLAQIAEGELTAATGYEILEVAEGWCRWAEDQKGSEQQAGLTRAVALFSKVIAKADGLEKLKIEKRQAEVAALLHKSQPGLLDLVPGAAAAYSLRSLRNGYTGPVVTVRRSSDSTEANFTATQVADGTLAAWCGAGDGFVKTWFDQSGNARNASQTTAASQPKIVSSGVVIAQDGKPALQFDGTDDYFSASVTGFQSIQNLTVSTVFSSALAAAADAQTATLWGFGESLYVGPATSLLSGEYITVTFDNTSSRRIGSSVYRRIANESSVLFSTHLQSGTAVFANGVSVSLDLAFNMSTTTPAAPSNTEYTANDIVSIGAIVSSGAMIRFAQQKFQELIFFPSDLTAQRELIEGNVAWAYSQ